MATESATEDNSELVGNAQSIAKSHANNSRAMFSNGFVERRDLEQYFWNDRTVERLIHALSSVQTGECCCLTTPTLASAFWRRCERAERLFDIDGRFAYLPKFTLYDMLSPPESIEDEDYWIIVVDPPFFQVPMQRIHETVMRLCKGNTRCKLMIGFLAREEATLLRYFRPFGLRRSNFLLEYAHVNPNKWTNYALYTNVNLPGIKYK